MEVERVMKLAFCSEEEAKSALEKADGDVVEAISIIMDIPPPKQKELTGEQMMFAQMRKNMEAMNKSIEDGFKKSDQHDSSSQELSSIHVLPLEEMTLHSDCIQNSQIPTLELEEQTQETACQ